MTDNGDALESLGSRVTALENEMADVRALAAGADREAADCRAELRAHTAVLNALRATQVEHGDRLDGLTEEVRTGFAEVRGELTEMRVEIGAVKTELAEMGAGFATMHDSMAHVVALLERIAPDEPSDS